MSWNIYAMRLCHMRCAVSVQGLDPVATCKRYKYNLRSSSQFETVFIVDGYRPRPTPHVANYWDGGAKVSFRPAIIAYRYAKFTSDSPYISWCVRIAFILVRFCIPGLQESSPEELNMHKNSSRPGLRIAPDATVGGYIALPQTP